MKIWQELGIEPTTDVQRIRQAYAGRLKRLNPEDDAEGFQRLRAAYERAMAHAVLVGKGLGQGGNLPPRSFSAPRGAVTAAADECIAAAPPVPAAVSSLLKGLLAADTAQRHELLERMLNAPGWGGLDFRRDLQPALARALYSGYDQYHELVGLLSDRFGWLGQLDAVGEVDAAVLALLGRHAARAWLDEISEVARGDRRLRTAMRLLRRPVDEAAFYRYARWKGNLEEMHYLLRELLDEYPGVLHEFDAGSASWWDQYLAQPQETLNQQCERAIQSGFFSMFALLAVALLGQKIFAPQAHLGNGLIWLALILAALLWPLLRVRPPSAARRRA